MTLPSDARTKRLNRPTLANCLHGVDDADPEHQLGDTIGALFHAIHRPYDISADPERISHIKSTKHASRQAPPSQCPRSGPRSRSGAEARGRVAPKSVRLGRYQSQFFKMALPRGARRRRGAPDPRSLLERGPGHLPRAAER